MVIDVLDLYPDLGKDLRKQFDDLVKTANERNLTAPERQDIDRLLTDISNAYTKSTGGDYSRIIQDAERIIAPLTQEDHEHNRQLAREYYALLLKDLKKLLEEGKGDRAFTATMEALQRTEDLYADAFNYICSHIRHQIKALDYYHLDKEVLFLKAEEKAAEWYPKPQEWQRTPEDPQGMAERQKMTDKRLPPKVIAKEILGIDYPIDKVNGNIWNLLAGAEKNGQLAIRFNMAKHNSGKAANVLYSIDFNNLGPEVTITKQLTPFDKRVMISAAALYNAGNNIVSATQIFEKMGNSRKPNTKAIDKINESITKLQAAHIFITNDMGDNAETETYRKAAVFKYDGSLLPMERLSAYINGQLAESAIRLFREPPLVSFARSRKQITTVGVELLQSPVNKTDQNLMIDDYLIDRIAKMKRAEANRKKPITKILFMSLFNDCNIKTPKQKSRAPETISRYLEHYKNCGYISGYEMTKEGVIISL